MNTVTFTGNQAELLDLIGFVERSTLILKYDASFNTEIPKRCPFCTTGLFSSYCNLEQHLANKHGKTFDVADFVDKTTAQGATNEEIIAQLKSMVKALQSKS